MATTTAQPTEPRSATGPAPRDFRQEVTDNIVRMLERGVAPWQKPWEPGSGSLGIPFNPTSERSYRGGKDVYKRQPAQDQQVGVPRPGPPRFALAVADQMPHARNSTGRRP